MYVKIIIYANKERFSGILISGEHKKKINGVVNGKSALTNTLIGLNKMIRKIKYPVELEIVNNKRSIRQILDEGIETYKNQDYILENIELWKEFSALINQHINCSFTYHTEKQNDKKIFDGLFRNCVYKKF